jgi:hypothetical protein
MMPSDEPDLFTELDAADAIVMGRIEAVVTEWGCRMLDGDVFEYRNLGGEAARAMVASRHQRGLGGVLVSREVTTGPWEEVPDAR